MKLTAKLEKIPSYVSVQIQIKDISEIKLCYTFFFFFDNPGIRTLVRLSHRVQPELEGPGGQTETMLNPLWPGLELMMAGTSAEVPIPPDHEARLTLLHLTSSCVVLLKCTHSQFKTSTFCEQHIIRLLTHIK